jgi:hypothetical protein
MTSPPEPNRRRSDGWPITLAASGFVLVLVVFMLRVVGCSR